MNINSETLPAPQAEDAHPTEPSNPEVVVLRWIKAQDHFTTIRHLDSTWSVITTPRSNPKAGLSLTTPDLLRTLIGEARRLAPDSVLEEAESDQPSSIPKTNETCASLDTKRLDWLETQKQEWHACWGGGREPDSVTVWVNPSASWKVERSIDDRTYDYPSELKAMSVREAIDAAMSASRPKEGE